MRRDREEDKRQLVENDAKQQALYDKQVADQTATEQRLRGEQDASLARVRGEIPGMQAQLGDDLLKQQQHAYTRMAPQMEARLNALGLLQSGALPEAQAKYQGDLEAQRQAALADFGTNAAQRLNIEQPLANSSADVGRQYDSLKSNLDLAKTNLSQTFANQNNANLNQASREQYLAGLAAANNAAAQSSANAYLQFGSQLGSGAMNYYGQKQNNDALRALYQQRGGYNGGWGGNGGYGGYA